LQIGEAVLLRPDSQEQFLRRGLTVALPFLMIGVRFCTPNKTNSIQTLLAFGG
jgi:hypothetical protein